MSDNAGPVGDATPDQMPDSGPGALVRDRQLIVVSNRQPYKHQRDEGEIGVDRHTGGLTEGLDPVMQRTGGTWIAWGDGDGDAEVVDADDCVTVPPDDPDYRLKRIWLSEEQVRDYYYGFSNQVLWPICHSALTQVQCDASFWQRYRSVNQQFADAIVDHVEDQPLVWLQDYHLALVPKLARARLPDDALLMHFWHIPWPAWDTFRACPHRQELLEGLLGNDLIGFHVPRYRTNFLRCVETAFDDAVVDWEAGDVTYQGQVTAVEAIPMGVPFDSIRQSASPPNTESFWSWLERAHDVSDGMHIAVGVDRLDYTKGITERLRALERFWEAYPAWRSDFTYFQIGSESRSRIPAYREVQERVADEVERINQRFGTDSWQPVVYVTDRLSQTELYDLYRRADVAIVSPIRDGMNLVAQEYVAAQADGDGALVLSDQAGVHDALGEHAVTVTPSDTEAFAEAIAGALSMPPVERRRRMSNLRQWISDHDLERWLKDNLRAATKTAPPDTQSCSTT